MGRSLFIPLVHKSVHQRWCPTQNSTVTGVSTLEIRGWPNVSPDDRMPHLSLEETGDLLPLKRIEVEVYELLCHLSLDVTSELDPQLVHRQLLCQAGLQLFCFLMYTSQTKKSGAVNRVEGWTNYIRFRRRSRFIERIKQTASPVFRAKSNEQSEPLSPFPLPPTPPPPSRPAPPLAPPQHPPSPLTPPLPPPLAANPPVPGKASPKIPSCTTTSTPYPPASSL